MIRGMYVAAAGMLPRMSQMNNVADNLANSATHGYKGSSVFLRSLIDAQYALDHATGTERTVPPEEIWTDFNQGTFDPTGAPFDVALNGSGFFRFMDVQGNMLYSRDGRLHRDINGLMVNQQGMFLLNDRGVPINVQGNEITIDPDGTLYANGAEEDTIGLADFAQADYPQLLRAGSGMFQRPPAVNEGTVSDNTVFMQGYLEDSNVDSIQTMVDMIQIFREFELGQRSIQIQDQTLQRTVTEVGAIR